MATQKMVYVSSNDYWGYAKSDFNTALNFYEYTWVVPTTMYEDMDEENQSQLYPCALFYVQGVTDNHNFLTLSVDVDSDDAKVIGMKGRKRKTINFSVGSPSSYKVGSLSMKEAPSGSTSVEEIQKGVEDGSNKTEGSFIVSGFLTEPEQIAEAVGLQSESKSAESPLDVPATPSEYEPADPQVNPVEESYSAEEISDAYPQESAQTGGHTSGRGVPVAYGSGSSQNLEPPVLVDEEMAAEEIDAAPVQITDAYPQSSAEIGDVQAGQGVPVSYGSGSSQYIEPPVIVEAETVINDDYMDNYAEYDQGYDDKLDESLGERDGAERNFTQSRKSRRDESKGTEKYDDSRPYSSVGTMDAEQQVGLPVIPDSYGNDSATEMSGRGVPVWYGSAETTDFYPQSSAEIGNEQSGYGVPVSYGSGSSQYIEPPVIVDEEMASEHHKGQGYDDELDESLGMRHRGRKSQSRKSRRDESKGTEKALGHRAYSGVRAMDAEYQHSRRGSGGRWRSKRDIRNEVFGETMENQMRGYWRTGIVGTEPVVGDDIARSNAAKRFGYFTKPAEYDANRRQWSKGPNFQQARKIAKGVAWERVENLGLAAEAEVLVAESAFDKLAAKIARQYEKKGKTPEEARRIGAATAYDIGVSKYGRRGMAAKSRAGMRAHSAEDYSYQGTGGDIDIPIPAEAGEANPMEFVELGAYDVPVIPNTVGTDSAGGSGYGVPQWYGADTLGFEADFEASRMVDMLDEGAPTAMGKNTKVIGIAAVIGLIGGAWMARNN